LLVWLAVANVYHCRLETRRRRRSRFLDRRKWA
jgi:hypothetical protein